MLIPPYRLKLTGSSIVGLAPTEQGVVEVKGNHYWAPNRRETYRVVSGLAVPKDPVQYQFSASDALRCCLPLVSVIFLEVEDEAEGWLSARRPALVDDWELMLRLRFVC